MCWQAFVPSMSSSSPRAGRSRDRRLGRVERCVFLGSITRVVLRMDEGHLTVELQGRRDDLVPGAEIAVRIPADALLKLDDA